MLRDYQQRAIDDLHDYLKNYDNTMELRMKEVKRLILLSVGFIFAMYVTLELALFLRGGVM